MTFLRHRDLARTELIVKALQTLHFLLNGRFDGGGTIDAMKDDLQGHKYLT